MNKHELMSKSEEELIEIIIKIKDKMRKRPQVQLQHKESKGCGKYKNGWVKNSK